MINYGTWRPSLCGNYGIPQLGGSYDISLTHQFMALISQDWPYISQVKKPWSYWSFGLPDLTAWIYWIHCRDSPFLVGFPTFFFWCGMFILYSHRIWETRRLWYMPKWWDSQQGRIDISKKCAVKMNQVAFCSRICLDMCTPWNGAWARFILFFNTVAPVAKQESHGITNPISHRSSKHQLDSSRWKLLRQRACVWWCQGVWVAKRTVKIHEYHQYFTNVSEC